MGREVLTRLHATGKYEITCLGWYYDGRPYDTTALPFESYGTGESQHVTVGTAGVDAPGRNIVARSITPSDFDFALCSRAPLRQACARSDGVMRRRHASHMRHSYSYS